MDVLSSCQPASVKISGRGGLFRSLLLRLDAEQVLAGEMGRSSGAPPSRSRCSRQYSA